RFNRAVARIRELTNALEDLPAGEPSAGAVLREGLEAATRLIGPMMPHLAEEMWQTLGHTELIADTPWPKADPELARDEQVTIAVQVNGKLRGTVELPRDAAAGDVEQAALALPQVANQLAGRPPKKNRRRAQPHREPCGLNGRSPRPASTGARRPARAPWLRLGAALRRPRDRPGRPRVARDQGRPDRRAHRPATRFGIA